MHSRIGNAATDVAVFIIREYASTATFLIAAFFKLQVLLYMCSTCVPCSLLESVQLHVCIGTSATVFKI